mgnify:CR=1 FL=1|jgi:hypothetical protein
MGRTMPLLLLLAVAAIWLSWRHYANARALLQNWAEASGLRILHAKSSAFWLSLPLSMWFTTSRYQVVYHVSVYDEASHRIRSGWVRLGTRWWGVMESDAVDVKWDDAV